MSGDGIFNWWPMRTSDVTAWAALLADIREVDHTWEYFTETELLEEFDDPRRNFEDGSIVVFAGDTMVGYGVLVTRSTAEPDHDMRFDGGVHPAYRGRGLGSQLLDWAEPAARRLHRALYPGHPLSLAGSCSIDSPAAMALYESRGYEQVRWFNGMVRDLGDAVGGPVAPPGVEIAPWRPEFSEAARTMRNEAFRDHWGSTDAAPEDWAHFMAVAAFRPEHSFLAFA
ncbi:MAG TPA: GNAT family N-acetyltransferase, partial [Acidimicrobiales bacterium]|nr:GNAT family N-acetyltransferase [Acidimicrobiales bacterium]